VRDGASSTMASWDGGFVANKASSDGDSDMVTSGDLVSGSGVDEETGSCTGEGRRSSGECEVVKAD
jgi:hypothetical protein